MSEISKHHNKAEQSELGHSSLYDTDYNPERLFAIPRAGSVKK